MTEGYIGLAEHAEVPLHGVTGAYLKVLNE
jgi:hypothetical protein